MSNTSASTEESTPQNELEIALQSTPRVASAISGVPDAGTPNATYLSRLGNGEDFIPQGVTNYFARGADPDTENPPRHSNGAAAEGDDDTASTTTDLTELSTTAQAGSLAPSGSASPASQLSFDEVESKGDMDETSARTEDYGEDTGPQKSDLSPFMHEDHSSAQIPPPPHLNLAPRTHPLADGEAQHGGVPLRESVQAKLDEERAEGVRSPAYDGAGPSTEFKANEEDDYSSDEGRDAQEGKAKRLVKRLKARRRRWSRGRT
ncbi:hypothetical protein B0H17DRAFT_1086771 [Mycena rosella]|uniref:Uncharacterized protein n=1 Tax=Mycena rosella TaxID=1033263 RepID=A0AAD7CXS9_MYCRO|nr:hypothetical protein B0H17DRAFT_1086771 [Mycena rosella]